jgi:hypothetical protein
MKELEEAWNAVWDVLPAGWTVSRPTYPLGERRLPGRLLPRHALPGGQTDPPYWEAIGRTEADALRELAQCIRELLDGRVPK